MRKSAVIVAALLATLMMLTGCKVQTVQQYEAEQDKNNKVVVVADEDKAEKEKPVVKEATSTTEKTSDSKKVAEKSTVVKDGEVAKSAAEVVEKPTATKKETAVEKPITPNKATSENQSKASTTVEKEPAAQAETKKTVEKKETQTASKQSTTVEKKPTSTVETAEKPKQAEKPTKNTQTATATTKPITKPIVQPAKKEYVTVAIGMHVLQEETNYAKLPEALQNEQYVPKSGIVASGKLEISKGATAWDAILKLAQSKNIHLDYEYKAMFSGMYIKGINHVYEKDAGPSSGWMYAVNGKLAPVGVSQYELHADDVIKLEYSVTGGSDIRW